MDYVLTAEELYKEYKGGRALDGLSLHVPRGAIYGLVGKNGAGKTTLIRILCALQAPTAGEYTIFGVNGRDRGILQARGRMGAVVEAPAVYQELTAEENLRIQYEVLGRREPDTIPGLLELVGLGDTGKKKVKNFSLGMRQRLGIAVALAGEPELLILDEPVNGLDPQGIIEMRRLLQKLNREKGVTILISSHILDELAKLATHYGFIDKGRMVEELAAADVGEGLEKHYMKLMGGDWDE
ncbi:MAG: ATP-binding cassette domain-containing protein [Oscillospiraceae bacterium]|nr:ATP-binding cassette domain-containing protein [Oscillospiraceae bacterium]